MKKILLISAMAAVAFGASAEFRWGPTAGVNISSLHWKQDLVDTKCRAGVNVGVMGEVMIPGIGFGIDFGLRYAMRGANVDFGAREIWASSGYEKQNVWLHTLQIPVDLRFKWTRMDGLEQYVAPFAYVGPVFNFTVGTNDAPMLDHPAGSVGLQCGIGGEFLTRYQLSVGYIWDVTYDCRTVKLDNFSARSHGWQVNVAMLF